jgi:isopenicillin-N epimerase
MTSSANCSAAALPGRYASPVNRHPDIDPAAPGASAEAPAHTIRPACSALARHWGLDPDVVFLNHGSYGACPLATLGAQARLRAQMEAEPVRFFNVDAAPMLHAARQRLAQFVGCDAAGLAFVPNATTGVATALECLPLAPGEEILAPIHEYPACLNNARRIAARRGGSVRLCSWPFPVSDPEEVVQAVLEAVTPRVRILLISHITSATGVILPVERLVRELEPRGVHVVIDGAHAPGQIDLDISAVGRPGGWTGRSATGRGGGGRAPSAYVANLHKWACAPKGAAMMWVREDLRERFRPLVLSNYAELPAPNGRSRLHAEFDFTGTGDVTAWLAIPEAIDVMEHMAPADRGEAGWTAIRAHNRRLQLAGRRIVCEALGVEPPAPESMLGAMCTFILPRHPPELQERLRLRPTAYHDALQDALLARWGIQIPVMYLPGEGGQPGPRAVRLSAQLYNAEEQYGYLADALRAELARERQT